MVPARKSVLLALAFLALALKAAPDASAASAADPVKIWVLLKDKGPGALATAARAKASAAPHSAQAARAFENLPLHRPYLEALGARGFALDAGLKWQNRVSGRIAADKV